MNIQYLHTHNPKSLAKLLAGLLKGSRTSWGDTKVFIDYKAELDTVLTKSEKKEFFKLVFEEYNKLIIKGR